MHLELNFNPENKNDIFHIPLWRAEQIVKGLTDIAKDVARNYADYKIEGTGELIGKHRLHEGKALERMLTLSRNEYEWAFIIFSATSIFDSIRTLQKIYHAQGFLNKVLNNTK